MTDTAPARRKGIRQPNPIVEPVRDEQPRLVAQARAQAEKARRQATLEEPWYSVLDAVPAYNADGHRTGHAVAMPSAAAKELWGARMAFDLLDAGDDDDLISDIQTRYYRELGGDTGCLHLVAFSALRAVAAGVVPQLLEDLEENASNHDGRVRIAEGRTKAWNARVADLRPTTTGTER